MKTKLSSIIAIIAIITISIIACKDGDDDKPTEEQPVATTLTLTIKSVIVTVNYKKKPSDPIPAQVTKIKTAATALDTSGTNASKNTMTNMTNREGTYTINVVYDDTSFDGFSATDGQTLEVHDSWLISAEGDALDLVTLRDAFNAMLELPAVAMQYDRATNTIFIT